MSADADTVDARLSPDEAAAFLKVTRMTLARWRREGTGPHYVMRTTHRVLYPRTSLETWARLHPPRDQARTQADRPESCGCAPDLLPHRWDAFSYCAAHHCLFRRGRLGGSDPRWLSVAFEVPTHRSGHCKLKTSTGKSTVATLIVWRCVHGPASIPPSHVLDVRDGDPLNARPENLRCATRSQDNWNRAINRTNTFPKGVTQTRGGRFQAQVTKHRKRYRRLFDTLEEAEAYVRFLRETLHGDFHRHGSPGTRWDRGPHKAPQAGLGC